jgi:intracellular multiplication protein IcmE
MSTDFNETPGAARYRKPGGSALGQMWKNPIFKLISVVVLVGGVGLAGVQFMQTRTTEQQSIIPSGTTTAAPTQTDTGEVSPEYQRAVNELDQTRAEAALGRGESALPTPMSSPVASPTVDTAVAAEDTRDPLRDFERMLQANQVNQQAAAPELAVPEAPPVNPEVVQNLSRTYRAQMDMLMTQWNPTAMTVMAGTAKTDDELGAGGGDAGGGAGQEAPKRQLISAGAVYYAQMLMEANSDIPGPIMAQILTGPLAGGKAIGSFETYRNHLMIRFRTVSIRGRQITVDILALDPETTLGGVATEVDPRYFSRVVIPAAAEFISAYGEAISEPTSTTTVSGSGASSITTNSQDGNDSKDAFYKGLGSAFESVSEFVREEGASIKRLVRVGVGTPLGLFFVSPVEE